MDFFYKLKCKVCLSFYKENFTFEFNFKFIIMKTNYLFPNSFKNVSGIVFLLSLLGLIFVPIINKDAETIKLEINVFAILYDEGLSTKSLAWINDDIFPEIIGVVLILSGIIFAFSKEKTEDEMVSKIRLESLVWATYVNYACLLFCILFIYGLPFFNIMVYNMFTLLLIFIIRFHWMLFQNNTLAGDEE